MKDFRTQMLLLKATCYVTIITGFISLLATYESTQGPWLMIHNLLSASEIPRNTFSEDSLTLNAIIGGLMIGWGSMMLLLAEKVTKLAKVWNAMVSGLILWFVFDSAGSVFSGVYLNVVLNICFISIFMIPLILLKPNTDTLSESIR